jgi:hypothetical protein
MRGAIPSFPNTSSWRGAHLKRSDSFTFTFTLDVVRKIITPYIMPIHTLRGNIWRGGGIKHLVIHS